MKLIKFDVNVHIDKNCIIEVSGVTSDVVRTLGVIETTFCFGHSDIQFDISLVENDFPIPCDGILGMDFFRNHPCTIDFKTNCFKIFEKSHTLDTKTMQYQNIVKIPPRAEIIKKIYIQTREDLICHSKQLSNKSVYIGNCLVRPNNNFAYVPILNGTHDEVEVDLNSIHFEPLKNYSILSLENNIERVTKIKEDVNLQHLNDEEKTSIINIIEKYHDVFFVEGDKLTSTNATPHKINTSSEKPNV